MPVAKVVNAQRDFSGGEADVWLKRADDHPMLKSTVRQGSNWRQLSSRAVTNRPGRRMLALDGLRTDEVIMSPGNNFYLVFGNTYLRVYNAVFTKVFEQFGMLWSTTTYKQVVWDVYKLSVYITFDGMVPKVLSWDGVSQSSTWTLTDYAEDVTGGQKRTIFYRLSPLGVTMLPVQVGVTPVFDLFFSSGIASASMVGTRMRYITSQLLITGFVSSTHLVALQEEVVHSATQVNFAPGTFVSSFFHVGDEVIGQTSGARGLVTISNDAGPDILVQRFTSVVFTIGESLVGPNGNAVSTAIFAFPPQAITVWDEEVMNAFRGYPRSCFVDQGRLVFTDFPALPQLITWSFVGVFTDLYTDANNAGATNAIQELVPGKSRVLYGLAGAQGSEFIFCDNAIYYIPIDQNTPLRPGSVAFNTLLSEGIQQVQPRPVQQSIVFLSAGSTQLKAVQAIGAYNRPFIVDDISELHSHLLVSPVAIAAPGGSDQYEESYFYLANSDGTIVLCSYNIKNGVIDIPTIGFLPWSGGTSATWISALKGHSDVLVTGAYTLAGARSIIEQVDSTQFLDAAFLYNSPPAALAGPVGTGPLWFIASGSVDVMDGGRMMGTYQVDATGHLVPQNNAGENFLSATLTVGQAWTATLEPFIPAVQPGQDVNQRMRKRRVARFETYVQNSSGFTFCRLFGGTATRTSPAAGTIMQRRRIEAWNQDDDPTLTPPLREQAYSFRPIGRTHDPRFAIIKDTPGPLTILEIDVEVSV